MANSFCKYLIVDNQGSSFGYFTQTCYCKKPLFYIRLKCFNCPSYNTFDL